LWVANSGDNTIQRLDPTTGAPGPAIDVDDGPDGLAVDKSSVWVANGRAGTVMRIDATTGDQMSAPILVGSGPRGLAVVGDEVWVADELSQNVTRIVIATGHTHTIDVGDGPTALAVLGTSVWVAERYAADLVRIDPENETLHPIDVGAPVHGLAVADDRLWIVSGAFTSTSHRGGTLRVAAHRLPGKFTGIDPAKVYDLTSHHPLRVVYDGLLAYHYSGADPQVLVPDLATSVPVPTDGGRTYTFNLRPGIRYSTGEDVRASDFLRGVQRALLAKHGRPDFYSGIIGAKQCRATTCDLSKGVVVDDPTGRITLHLKAPDPQFLYKLTLLVVPTPQGTPMRNLTTPLPGTGPYRISSYLPKKAFALQRNPYFRQWSAPAQPAGFLDAITWVKVANTRAAADAVLQERADLAELTPLGGTSVAAGALVDALQVQQPSRLQHSVLQATTFGVVNSSQPPFRSRLARRAFNFAIDRNRAVALLGGPSVAPLSCQLIPPSMPSYRPYCPYSTGPPDTVPGARPRESTRVGPALGHPGDASQRRRPGR
jgi:streptogramin lyase